MQLLLLLLPTTLASYVMFKASLIFTTYSHLFIPLLIFLLSHNQANENVYIMWDSDYNHVMSIDAVKWS